MTQKQPAKQEKFRQNYQAPAYLIDKVDLCFHLDAENTRVDSTLLVRPNPLFPGQSNELVLDGVDLELFEVAIDDERLAPENYEITESSLRLLTLPRQPFQLQLSVGVDPTANSSLEGLYISNKKYCTQCEAEGFRKITYFPDRPDVLAEYRTKIIADKKAFPDLLSNGNFVESGEEGDKHWVLWHDPFPKPSYLFALVAGDFDRLDDKFITESRREVLLQIYVDKGKLDQCDHAMESLKRAMRWDEKTYGLEYDLDRYMIVAVGDFNMGAMENKGLNIFNTKYVLANDKTATDQDFDGVESVIAHEYFHNWTGNRVTCRDWFQLSLKEGLTVYRDQEFSADMGSRAAKRIDDVKVIRGAQFSEDAGPMSHPIRPDSYIEMNNFYTVTVYNKGAEVIRMLETMLGKDGFRRGMDLYFHRHDGQAVTCDDFVAAMEDANQFDLAQFRRWYSQAGTPEVKVSSEYKADKKQFILEFEQSCRTYHSGDNLSFHIPIKLALLDENGKEQTLQLGENHKDRELLEGDVLHLKRGKHRFVFDNMSEKTVPSLGRNFSAPVKIQYEFDTAELAFLIAHDNDDFNRWDASQTLYTREIYRLADEGAASAKVDDQVLSAIGAILEQGDLDKVLQAQTLMLPSMASLLEYRAKVDIDALLAARNAFADAINVGFADRWLGLYQSHAQAKTGDEQNLRANRYMKNVALAKMLAGGHSNEAEALAIKQFETADNMTDELAAMSALVNSESQAKQSVLEAFYKKWEGEALVVDKWFATQAASEKTADLDYIQKLAQHKAFDLKNPNKVRALIATFCSLNFQHFHAASGEGYHFLANTILDLNAINPQIAARLASIFNRCRKFDNSRVEIVRGCYKQILDHEELSSDVYEIVSKASVALHEDMK